MHVPIFSRSSVCRCCGKERVGRVAVARWLHQKGFYSAEFMARRIHMSTVAHHQPQARGACQFAWKKGAKMNGQGGVNGLLP